MHRLGYKFFPLSERSESASRVSAIILTEDWQLVSSLCTGRTRV